MCGCVLGQAMCFLGLFSAQLFNGVRVSVVCQDQFAATAVVTGCSSQVQGASCCAVFASEVAPFFFAGRQ